MAFPVLRRNRGGRVAGNNSQSIFAPATLLAVASFALIGSGVPLAQRSCAQPIRFADTIQLGGGVLPAVGIQVGYLDVGDLFTREAMIYGHLWPRFGNDDEALQVAAAVGVGLRIVGGLETLTLINPRMWDVHVGMRFGPSLLFRRNETQAQKNRRFSLFLDPLVRFTLSPGRQTYFLETGVQKPVIRAGVWLRL